MSSHNFAQELLDGLLDDPVSSMPPPFEDYWQVIPPYTLRPDFDEYYSIQCQSAELGGDLVQPSAELLDRFAPCPTSQSPPNPQSYFPSSSPRRATSTTSASSQPASTPTIASSDRPSVANSSLPASNNHATFIASASSYTSANLSGPTRPYQAQITSSIYGPSSTSSTSYAGLTASLPHAVFNSSLQTLAHSPGPAQPPTPTTSNVPLASSSTSPSLSRINQGNNNYGSLSRNRTPINAWFPANTMIGCLEACLFMEHVIGIPEFAVRLQRNGVTVDDCAKMQLDATNSLTIDIPNRAKARMRKALSAGGKRVFNLPSTTHWSKSTYPTVANGMGPRSDYTRNAWRLPATYGQNSPGSNAFHPVKLANFYHHLPANKWPTGKDRLLFTQVLEYDRANPQMGYTTLDILPII